VAVSLVAVLSCSGDEEAEPEGYSAAMKADFVEDCTESGTSGEACTCLYEAFESEVPFERFEELDQQLRSGSADIPADIEALAVGCVADPEAQGE
jgi:hypothetical protein